MTILNHTKDDLCINVLLTSVCNAGCSWCIANEYMEGKKSYSLMPEENVDILIGMLKKEKVSQVNLLGGEPSLHPRALEIGRRVYELGIPVGFSTNGLWSPAFRQMFERIDYPLEVEVTYLGNTHPNYTLEKLKQLGHTFYQLEGHLTSLGLIIATPTQPFSEHLDVAYKHGFDLRWALLEPTKRSGQTEGYRTRGNTRDLGKRAVEIVREANRRGINTWADLTVPRCAIENLELDLFTKENNDIQFKCPPFFDISPNLDIWRCLPLAPKETPKVTDFSSFREAYREVDKVKENYRKRGIFPECNDCVYLESICSGGPTIAKQLK